MKQNMQFKHLFSSLSLTQIQQKNCMVTITSQRVLLAHALLRKKNNFFYPQNCKINSNITDVYIYIYLFLLFPKFSLHAGGVS